MNAPTPTVVRRPVRRPNGSGKHMPRSFRTDPALWAHALEVAHSKGITLGSVLNKALEDLVADDNDA